MPKLDLNRLNSNPCLLLEEDLKLISLKDISPSLLNQLSIFVKEKYMKILILLIQLEIMI
ncbi:hypothetical protein J6TS2_13470 [Heyndrickxia sporothermodurans]|nr:hypothetical protein J6TS2_13470 [Heyndrickxia sporothermodurans]